MFGNVYLPKTIRAVVEVSSRPSSGEFVLVRPRCLLAVRCLTTAVCLVTFTAGCGSGEPAVEKNVSGKITYEDGSLIPAGQIQLAFVPTARPPSASNRARFGTAKVHVPDGTFDAVVSHPHGKGIPAGEYKVVVLPTTAPRTGKRGETLQPLDVVPSEYTSWETTPLLVDSNDLPWNLLIKKPQLEQKE